MLGSPVEQVIDHKVDKIRKLVCHQKRTLKPLRIFSCRKICIYLTNKNYEKNYHPLKPYEMNFSEKKIQYIKAYVTCKATSDQKFAER